jgi:hypothetical protein
MIRTTDPFTITFTTPSHGPQVYVTNALMERHHQFPTSTTTAPPKLLELGLYLDWRPPPRKAACHFVIDTVEGLLNIFCSQILKKLY